MTVSLEDVRGAALRIAPHVVRTPVVRSAEIDAEFSGEIFFKCENLQRTGAFKLRGALNAVAQLPPDALERGVTTHSSGNHAAALTLAARLFGASAVVVMPRGASRAKRDNVLRHGGEIIECEPTQQAREAACNALVAERGLTLVPPYDDHRIIAGQGTAALELCSEIPDLDLLVCPVGGGGLLSGTAVVGKGLPHSMAVVGVEPEGNSDAHDSFKAGERREPEAPPDTVADGLRATIGHQTFDHIKALVDDIVLVDDPTIVAATRTLWDRLKLVVEPSAAVPFAAIAAGRLDIRGKRVGVVLSGGNVDLSALPWRCDPCPLAAS